jgi:salicylate biosynthesis isochorismate synthase/menaquinone-specific isochorismate synthase
VSVTPRVSEQPFRLGSEALGELEERIGRALVIARRDGRAAFAAVTVPVPAGLDVSGAVLAARRARDRFVCLEQPERDGFALATLGTAALLEERGPRRFPRAAAACRELAARVSAGDPAHDAGAPSHAGPVLVGGFAFAAEGGGSPEWSSLAPAQLVLPEVALARHGGEARLTLCVRVEPDDDPDASVERARRRLAELAPAAPPLLDPDPRERPRVASAAPAAHYEEAVARAVERIRAGELEKVVLAREVRVHLPAPVDAGAVLGALRDAFPACYCYCVGTPELALVGASPELLVRREGARVQTVALAGTARRSADPAVDDHLGEQLLRSSKDREEQAIVARRVESALRPGSVWTAAAEEPVLVKVQNVQHLATPVRAQLAEPLHAVELAGLLHPTPAVGGEPAGAAAEAIPALEGLDRGWYAGAVGWADLAEDGEYCVALRCALLRDRVAHLYAGCGIVRDSVPSEELAESEVKLEALLPLLA